MIIFIVSAVLLVCVFIFISKEEEQGNDYNDISTKPLTVEQQKASRITGLIFGIFHCYYGCLKCSLHIFSLLSNYYWSDLDNSYGII